MSARKESGGEEKIICGNGRKVRGEMGNTRRRKLNLRH